MGSRKRSLEAHGNRLEIEGMSHVLSPESADWGEHTLKIDQFFTGSLIPDQQKLTEMEKSYSSNTLRRDQEVQSMANSPGTSQHYHQDQPIIRFVLNPTAQIENLKAV